MVVWLHQPAATIRHGEYCEKERRQGLYGIKDPVFQSCLGCQEFREVGVRTNRRLSLNNWFWKLMWLIPKPGGAWAFAPQITNSILSLPANRLMTLHGMFGLCLIFWGVAVNQGEKVVNGMINDWKATWFSEFTPRPYGFPMEDAQRLSYDQRIKDKLSQRFYSNAGADDIADFFSDAPKDAFRRSPSWSKKKMRVEILPKESIYEGQKQDIFKMPLDWSQGRRKTCDISSCKFNASDRFFVDLFGSMNRNFGSTLSSNVSKKLEYYNKHYLLESPEYLPSFAVFLGNVSSINALRGTQRRHPSVVAMRREQHNMFHSIMKKIARKIPVFTVPGAGDMSQDPRTETILDWESQFGRSIFSIIRGGICHLYLNYPLITRPKNAWKEYRILEDWWKRNLRICDEHKFPIFLYSHHALDVPIFIPKEILSFNVPTEKEATRDAQVAFHKELENLMTVRHFLLQIINRP
eukprot:GHVP01069156.1.p1 GENE.GHVP01069156.1~~GHVP01069156.1.p1  ORF type:complete len:465 (+),score=62.12 GHVP01069156.1:30-1424(+)